MPRHLMFDWTDLAFGSKKSVNQLRAIFIAAPRDMSAARFTQLVKTWLPKGNIVLGIAKEPFIAELDNQPQFATLQVTTVQNIIDKVNASASPHKIYTLSYFQRELTYIIEKLTFKKALFVNGSWYRAFHLRPEFYLLTKKRLDYELVTPFASEEEAQQYAQITSLPTLPTSGSFSKEEMLALANQAATHSFAYSEFQTGVSLGRKNGATYTLLATAHNQVVPYETYAMHHGASREVNFSPTNDLNHYDVIHAEVACIIQAQKQKLDLHGTTLFINLLPCPSCARMFTQTDIAEFVYREDHSDGYGVRMLEAAGKKVTRIVG